MLVVDHTTELNLGSSRRSGAMSASRTTGSSTDLPVEMLEEILPHLPGQDIVEMETVRSVYQSRPHDFALTSLT
jgi:hypothetical protein